MQPGPQGPGGPVAPNGPPPEVVQAIAQATGHAPEVVAAFIASLPPDRAPQIVMGLVRSGEIVTALDNFAAQQGGGMGPMAPPNPPPAMPMDPAAMQPPVGVAPGGDLLPSLPPQAGPQSVPPGGPQPPGGGQPPDRYQRERRGRRDRPEPRGPRPKLDDFRLPEPEPSVWGDEGPGYKDVVDLWRRAETRWRPRNQRIERDRRGIAMRRVTTDTQDRPVEETAGDAVYVGSFAPELVKRVVGAVLPVKGLSYDIDPTAEDEEAVTAAQKVENWLRTFWNEAKNDWALRGTYGDVAPSLAYYEAAHTAIEGTTGWAVRLNERDLKKKRGKGAKSVGRRAITAEPVPLYQLYPMREAVLRVYTLPLADFKAEWGREKAVRDAIRAGENGDERYGEFARESQDSARVTVIAGGDDRWRWIAWAAGGGSSRTERGTGEVERWIVRPAEHGLGFRPYLVPPTWMDLAGPSEGDGRDSDHHFFANAGLMTYLHESRERLDKLLSMAMTQMEGIVNPVVDEFWEVGNNPLQGPDGQWARQTYSSKPGATNVRFAGDKVEVRTPTAAGSPDLGLLLQSTMAEFNSAYPPELGGRGSSQSGYERELRLDSASGAVIEPIRAQIVEARTLVSRLVCEAGYRLVGGGDAKALYDQLELRAARDAMKGRGTVDVVTKEEFQACRIDRWAEAVRVEYVDDDLATKARVIQIGAMAVEKEIWSRLRAQKAAGVVDPEAENEQILLEFMLTKPSLRRMMAEDTLLNFSPERVQRLLLYEREEAMKGQQEGGQPGMPSLPGPPPPAPGGPAAPPPAMVGNVQGSPTGPVPIGGV